MAVEIKVVLQTIIIRILREDLEVAIPKGAILVALAAMVLTLVTIPKVISSL